ncbi:MAG: LPS-assembly protein LptD [Phycisphaerales bacterium]|nr:MAG: LPS-assembly protein LptD [Phycisphaerales bacterium]
MLARDGVITVFAPDRTLVSGEEENALIVEGGVVLQHIDRVGGRTVQLSAERAVVFLSPGPIAETLRMGPDDVRGVYLEGNVVATDGGYTLRGPRVFYDVATDRAIVLDAVFWTYNETRGMPLYVRAGAIRQEAQNQWSARRVVVSNTSFAEPHLSLGAETITIERSERINAPDRLIVDARGGAFRLGDTPVLPLPRYRGDLINTPLRSVTVGSRSGRPLVRTTWDMLALAGEEPSDTLQADLLLDGYFSRGPAVGADLEWDNNEVEGGAFGYIIHDDGTDRLSSGARIDQDNEVRGMILFENRWRINEEWSLFLEAAYLSDETFVDAFFPSLAVTRREFASSLYLRRLDERSVFSLEARGNFNDFTANQYLLQSQGFNVERLPEVRYSRVADSFMDGALTYTSETSLSRLNMRFTRPRLSELGFDTSARSRAGFGLEPGDSLADQLRMQGFSQSPVARFDSRHEITAPLEFGALRVTPFAVGRVTAYDDNFSDFAPDENDKHRLFGALGVRLWTSFQRIDDGVSSSVLDLHRMRHIIEPSFTIWHGESSRSSDTYPVYDTRVEDLATGTAFRAGVSNTWQTMRGGPGQWRSVDWLTIRTDYIWSSNDADRRSPVGRWFESRPELSNLGEYATADVIWQTTDSIALSSNVIYDFEEDDVARVSAGVLLDHGHGVASYAEVIHLEPRDSTVIDFGARWDASRRYSFAANAVYDADRDDFQTMAFDIERRFPQWSLDVSISRDRIRDDTVLAVRVRPAGASGLRGSGLVPGLRAASEERGGVRSAWPIN